jgi:hypothetical protein
MHIANMEEEANYINALDINALAVSVLPLFEPAGKHWVPFFVGELFQIIG